MFVIVSSNTAHTTCFFSTRLKRFRYFASTLPLHLISSACLRRQSNSYKPLQEHHGAGVRRSVNDGRSLSLTTQHRCQADHAIHQTRLHSFTVWRTLNRIRSRLQTEEGDWWTRPRAAFVLFSAHILTSPPRHIFQVLLADRNMLLF